jgi:peptide/nickel transport system substrate-binding protein
MTVKSLQVLSMLGRRYMLLRGTFRRVMTALCACAFAASASIPLSASRAATLKWASQEDAATMDPHAFNHGMTLTLLQHIYEGLVRRNTEMHIEPALAVSWTNPSPAVWRFKLRDGVVFHDGTPLSVADAVFSIKRAMGPGSDMKVFAASIVDVRPGDQPGTVDIETSAPNIALLQSIAELRIMSKLWAEKRDALSPADFRRGVENYATRNANGTGPFKLVSREPDLKTVLAANERWWDKPSHNITEAFLVKISSDATRVAALLSGEADFAYPIPIQDIDRVNKSGKAKVLQGHEVRAMFLAMDLARDELLYSSVKGRNPFKDHRVRQAFYQAIDVDVINARLMRGTAVPMGAVIASGVNAFDVALNQRAFKYDIEAAKKLMEEAGYPGGFQVTLDCPNDRYINSERVCQAIAGMLARIGVQVSINSIPAAKFFAKIGSRDTSLCFFGYAPSDLDAYNSLNVVVHTPDGNGNGQWNVGNYSNPEADAAIQAVQSELDPQRRQELVTRASTLHRQDIGHIPLYQPGITWGVRDGITAMPQIDNRVNLAFFHVN